MEKTEELAAEGESPEPHLVDHGGSLEKDWYIEYYALDPDTGQYVRKRYSKKFNRLNTLEDRYTEAALAMNELKGLLADSYHLPSKNKVVKDINLGKLSLPALIEHYAEFKTGKISREEVARYKRLARYIREFSTFPKTVRELTSQQVEGILDKVTEGRKPENEGVISNKTRNHYRNCIAITLNFAVKKKYLKENVAADVSLLRVEKGQLHIPFSMEQVVAIRKYAEANAENQYLLFMMLSLYTLARPGKELRLLKVRDIAPKTISIKPENSKTATLRQVDIAPPLEAMIERFKLRNYESGLFVFGRKGEPGKKPVGINFFYTIQSRVLKDLSFTDKAYTLYGFKHTGACHAYLSGVDIRTIQYLCGHKTVQQTEEYLINLNVLRPHAKEVAKMPDFINQL